MRLVIGLALLLAVASCGSMGEAARMSNAAEDRNRCLTIYGFAPDSDGLAYCMMQLDVIRAENDYRRRQALANALKDMGAAMQQNGASVRCTTTGTAFNNGATIGTVGTYNETTTCR